MMRFFKMGVALAAVPLLVGCAGYTPPRVRGPAYVPPELARSFEVDQRRAELKTVQSASQGPEGLEGTVLVATLQMQEDGLTLENVLNAVETHFPDLAAAQAALEAAEARVVQAEGAFDTLMSVESKNKLTGFYETQELEAGVEQPIQDGGMTVRGGYRYGLGNFASYDGDIETNSGGEFFLGFNVPLLRNSEIDGRRAELFKTQLARDAATPRIHELRVGLTRKASELYWKTVAAAGRVGIARDLLELARSRQQALAERVAEGDLPPIAVTDNNRLVAQREGLLVAATRDFERASFALSIYMRDSQGNPVRVSLEELPTFPSIPEISQEDLNNHVRFGLRYRPELRILEIELARADVERAKRDNELLPKLDVFGLASQDLGQSTSPGGVDDQVEFGVGLKFEMPLQQRVARGGLAVAQAKITQLRQKVRLQSDKIEAEIRDAASAYRRAREELLADIRSAEIAVVLEQAERDRLGEGESDLLRINLREQATARARSAVIKARSACFVALANYRAAMGLPETRAPIQNP